MEESIAVKAEYNTDAKMETTRKIFYVMTG